MSKALTPDSVSSQSDEDNQVANLDSKFSVIKKLDQMGTIVDHIIENKTFKELKSLAFQASARLSFSKIEEMKRIPELVGNGLSLSKQNKTSTGLHVSAMNQEQQERHITEQEDEEEQPAESLYVTSP